eukprot:TRINITY_DN34676_c0_g1_i2.p1 TRINITY_DN34676_c0_g1~~TRINITY_DN34676_c0_g1_i2.p1  ORF type:complete len:352 (+),score=25.98 TRINITY_DN34676_c0_g1_i2:327-1382(+)
MLAQDRQTMVDCQSTYHCHLKTRTQPDFLAPNITKQLLQHFRCQRGRNMVARIPEEKKLHRFTISDVFPEPEFPLRVMPVSHPISFSAHSHDFFELVCVRSGQGIHRATKPGSEVDCSFVIIFGDVMLIRPNGVHSFMSCSELTLYNILFLPDIIKDDAEELWQLPAFAVSNGSGMKLHLELQEKNAFEALVTKLGTELKNRNRGYRIVARSILKELLVIVGRLAPVEPVHLAGTNAGIESLHKQQLVNKAICLLEAGSNESFSIAGLAEQLKVSSSQLTRIFKATCGLTPNEYLIRHRLEKTKMMLMETDLTVSEIAFQNGFGEASYMSKCFRRLEGCTPNEFRLASRCI